jgi:16S rRNA (guanine1207-N2)-methyltransferase
VVVRGLRFAVCTKPGVPEHGAPDPAGLLLAANLDLGRSDVVLNLHCGAGLVGTVAATLAPEGRAVLADANVVAVEAASRTARANGVTNAEAIVSAGTSRLVPLPSIDVALVRVPKGRLPTLQLIWDAYRALRPDGRLYLAGPNDEGIESALTRARELFGNLAVLDYGKRARVGLATKAGPPEEIPAAFAHPLLDHATFHAYTVEVRGESIAVRSRPGVFSWEELDPATRLLAQAMEIGPRDRVLDLGCGTGILGVVAARHARGGQVWLVDADVDAVDSAVQTAAANGLRNCQVRLSDSTAAVAERRFDVVVTNPPFHLARGTERAVARQFFRDVAAVLAEHGRFYVVANRFLPYEADLQALFPVVETVRADNRYKVLLARRARGEALSTRSPRAR